MIIDLSDQVVKSIPPAKKRLEFRDLNEPTLRLRLQPTGNRSFYFVKSVKRKMKWIKLGNFPDINTETARSMCKCHLEDKTIVEGIISLGSLFDLYFKSRGRHCKTAEKIRRTWERFYSDWNLKDANKITRLDIQTRHNKIGAKTSVMANRGLEIIKAVYNFALDHDKVEYNPADRVKKHKEQARTRYITKEEMPMFMEALEKQPVIYREFFKLLLFTGARSGNVKAMMYDDIDFTRNLWTLPPDQTKNGDEAIVVLCEEAQRCISQMILETGDYDYVFAAKTKSKHIENIRDAWAQILEDSGLKDLKVHDLRRTLGSWQVAQGDSLKIVQETLTHRSEKSTQIYARLNKEPVRHSVEKAVTRMIKGDN